MRILRLEDAPEFAGLIADRIWNAWWRVENVPRKAIAERLGESLRREPVPTTFVALRGDMFLGTVSSSRRIWTSVLI